MSVPEYVVVSTTGEAHAQVFDVECRIAPMKIVATGRGGSRRAAEQAAAEAALARIEAVDGDGRGR
jgi:ribonuclease-3